MRRTEKRQIVVNLIEKDEVLNLRLLSKIIAERINNGGIRL